MGQRKSTRRKFTQEFKEDAVRLVLEQGRSKADVARSLGINAASLGLWVKAYQADSKGAFPGRGNEKLTPEQARIKELEKQLRKAQMERDILKKAWRTHRIKIQIYPRLQR